MHPERPQALRTIHRAPGALDCAEREALLDALVVVADEFVPPLTVRRSTTQSDLVGLRAEAPEGVGRYFAQMLDQHTLLAPGPDRALAAFCSFRVGHTPPVVADLGPCTYVSTIAVLPDHRRSGIARLLYGSLLALDGVRSRPVMLRTWSTNTGHLALLATLGFEVVSTLPDDRGTGVDTVYLARLPR
ncbi:MAG: GNAT family N-acetyltransferase [Cellulomonadaceae bacterium]|nr:GNAT family N-acetyltransferase [Cellulomonadaceae bacterium]